MARVHKGRVKQTSTTTGTGAYSLDAAIPAGFRGFVAAIGNANTFLGEVTDGVDWEEGEYTVNDLTPDTLTRTTILDSSNAGAAVSWPAGTKTIVCTSLASKYNAKDEISTVEQNALNLKANAGANADITSLTALSGINNGPPAGIRNWWINGAFEIWQRGAVTTSCPVATRTMSADCIYVTPVGATITQAQSSTVPSGARSRFSLLLMGATSVTTCLIGQRMEASVVPYLKRTITFQAKVYNGSGAAFTPSLLIGTPAATDDFTTVANRLTQALQSCADAVWTTVSYSVDISGYTNVDKGLQIELQLPSPALSTGTKAVNIAEIDVSPGGAVGVFECLPKAFEFIRCQRYYYKTFPQATAPAQNTAVTIGCYRLPVLTAGATAQRGLNHFFPVIMRTAPTITTYNASAANANGRNSVTGVDCPVTATASFEYGCLVSFTGDTGGLLGHLIFVHIVADAGL